MLPFPKKGNDHGTKGHETAGRGGKGEGMGLYRSDYPEVRVVDVGAIKELSAEQSGVVCLLVKVKP